MPATATSFYRIAVSSIEPYLDSLFTIPTFGASQIVLSDVDDGNFMPNLLNGDAAALVESAPPPPILSARVVL